MKKTKLLITMVALVLAMGLTACNNSSKSMIPFVELSMGMTNDQLKETYGSEYDDAGFDDGSTVLTTTVDGAEFTVHLKWDGEQLNSMWFETIVEDDKYEDFKAEVLDFYGDFELENQADVVENGMTEYNGMDISFLHFLIDTKDSSDTYLYVGSEAEEAEQSGK